MTDTKPLQNSMRSKSQSRLILLERQAPGHVTTLMQDTLSDIISLQFKKLSV
jgi:hypothetical protein